MGEVKSEPNRPVSVQCPERGEAGPLGRDQPGADLLLTEQEGANRNRVNSSQTSQVIILKAGHRVQCQKILLI